jgi:hypothetical protein
MSRACVLVFFRYHPRVGDQYKTQSTVFFNQVKKWEDKIDTFYLANGGWDFDWLPKNTIQYNQDNQSHWHYLNTLTEMVKEDQVLYLDPDILMYDPRIIERGFEALETYDVAGILDNSATLPLENEFDLFKPNKFRGVRRRFTPYLTFAKTKLLKGDHGLHSGIDFTPVAGKYDSMGQVTHEIMKRGCDYFEFEDDRNTLRLERDGSMTRDTWLDGSPYLWSTPHNKVKDLGYYHVRNSSVGLSILQEFQVNKPAYQARKNTMPFSEIMRLLSWQWMYDGASGNIIEWNDEYKDVLNDLGVEANIWDKYLCELEEYYPWLQKL